MRTTTLEPLSSGDARAAILSCHDELRSLVTETIHFAESGCDFEPLRTHARELRGRVGDVHLDEHTHAEHPRATRPGASGDRARLFGVSGDSRTGLGLLRCEYGPGPRTLSSQRKHRRRQT